MLFRDPFFQLYLLHVAALFVIALWPRISGGQSRDEQPRSLANDPAQTLAPAVPSPCLARHWSLGPRSRDLLLFQELEAAWRAECSARFAHVAQRISLI